MDKCLRYKNFIIFPLGLQYAKVPENVQAEPPETDKTTMKINKHHPLGWCCLDILMLQDKFLDIAVEAQVYHGNDGNCVACHKYNIKREEFTQYTVKHSGERTAADS